MRLNHLTFISLPISFTCLVLLAACDSKSVAEEGGGAGDISDTNSADAAEIAPFVGIYDLQDGWNGIDGDDAYLSIELPGSNGTATASLYDYDDASNCLPVNPTDGVVVVDDFTGGIFLNDILQFSDATLVLQGSTLTIEFNDDADLDADGSIQDRVSISAEKLNVSLITDAGNFCE